MIKKWLFCLIILPYLIPSANFTSTEPVTIRAGLYDNRPKIFRNEQGQPAGFWIDILDYIAREENWKIEYIYGTWEECLQKLERNEIDIMPDVAYSETRAQKFTFSTEPVYSSWSLVYTRKNSGISSIPDLKDKKISVLRGSVNYEGQGGIKELVQSFNIECEFIEVESYEQVFELVQIYEAEAGVSSKDFGFQHARDYNLVETPIIFCPVSLYFALPRDTLLTSSLIARIDHRVKELKENPDSEYYSSLKRWFGATEEQKVSIPPWLIWSLVGISILVIFSLSGNWVFKKQLAYRTRELREEIERRKQSEAELVKFKEQLEEQIKIRTLELENKNRELEQINVHLQELDRLKSIFLASMSHELRTPLNSIIGFTGILLMGMAGELNEEQKKQLTLVKNSAAHLLNLINDILDISKIEADKVELSPEHFLPSEIITEVLDTFRETAFKKGIYLKVEILKDATIYTDKRRFKQILLNLVSNAVKFTETGTIKITSTINGDGMLEIHITDTGMGIKEEDMHKLFQPFQQVGASLTKRYEGTGLGLYLTQKLVTLLGGKISAVSTYGKGSDFFFVLPLESKGESSNEKSSGN